MSRLESNIILTVFAAFYKRLCEKELALMVLFEPYQSLEENQRIILRDCLVKVVFNQPLGR